MILMVVQLDGPIGIFYLMKPADLIMFRIFVLHQCMLIQKQDNSFTRTHITTSGIFQNSLQPGAKRIISSPSRSQLLNTAFKNEDGTMVVVVMNQGNIKTPFFLWINGKAAETMALPHSINTYVIK